MAQYCNTMAALRKKIVSHKEVPKGIDILGTRWTYIIRSNIGCYVRVGDVEKGTDGKRGPTILPLHPHCSRGEHYFGFYHNYNLAGGSGEYDSFFILRGNKFRNVRNLSTDEAATTGTLHSKCRGGDFYMGTSKYHNFSASSIFIIIRANKKTFEVYGDLQTAEPSQYYKELYEETTDGPYNLHKNCQGGLYYWATKSKTWGEMEYYIVKGVDEFRAVKVHYTRNLRTDKDGKDIDLHPSVANFLPGGLSLQMTGDWDMLRSFKADQQPLPWTYKEEKKVGYSKEVVHSVEHHWDTEFKYSYEQQNKAGVVIEKVLDFSISQQVSYSKTHSYGGRVVDTEKEGRSEEKTETFDLSGTLQPGEKAYIWQYVIKERQGNEVVLFTPHIEITSTKNRPPRDPQALEDIVDEKQINE